MRELVLTTSFFVLLLVAVELPGLPGARTDAAGTAASQPRSSAVAPILAGAGFAVCVADTGWRKPTDTEQRAHLGADGRAEGIWESASGIGDQEFRAPAVLYDGNSIDGLQWIATLTGLWNVWGDSRTRPRTCWTEQPQVFLFGYEPIAYDAQDPNVGRLQVRPATGYRIVVLTGPIRPYIAVVSDQRLDVLEVPISWVTPPAPSLRAANDQ